MAFYPNNYYYQNPYVQGGQMPAQNNQIPQQPVQPQQQIRSDNFVHVNSEEEARNFPVGVGNAVQFKDDNKPFLYVKSMGFNQFEPPHFERYRLVKEEEPEPQNEDEHKDRYALLEDFNDLKDLVENMQKQLERVQAQEVKKPAPKARKEGGDNA